MNERQRQTFIQFLLMSSPQQYDYVLRTLTSNQLQVIVEIVFNVVKGTIPISDENKTTLMKRKRLIRGVLLKRISQQQRIYQLKKIRKLLPIIFQAFLTYGA